QSRSEVDDIDGGAAPVERDRIAVRNNARGIRLIHQTTQLAEAPAQRTARVVRHFPEQAAKPLASMGAAAQRQIGQQSASLFRPRQAAGPALERNAHLTQ